MNRREVFRTLAAGGATGALAAGAIIATVPAEATADPISPALAAAIERHRVASASVDAAGQALRPYAWAEFASSNADAATRAAFEARDAAFDAACCTATDAMDEVIAAPVLTLADMHAKAAYLAKVMPGTCEHNGSIAALLASMGASAPIAPRPTEPDPLGVLVADYSQGLVDFDASPAARTQAEDTALTQATWEPHYDRLCTNPPAATTLAGAVAAIRLVLHEEETCGHHEGFTINTLGAALAYFEGRA